ncbi:MAG: pyridoxamine 5'-phosphate oxidase family protein [Oscillospiraceae bacterium]|nr:pyridoxamine 5'-phosphate oxidase family protein [Oscillospiraceae bacterium]
MNANIFEKANQIIKGCDTAYFGVIDEDGFPSISAVSVIMPKNIFEVHFATQINGNKVKRLHKNNKASVCFKTDNCNITLVGEAEILTDQETKSRFWVLDWMPHIFPDGEADPNYCVVKMCTKRVSLWIDNEDAAFTIDALLTVQSRCGLLCDGCGFKESHGCIGCIALEGKPFWGECPVAKCSQNKGYTHCGECSDIPCDILKEFSCGEDEHSDKPTGARIAVCRGWAR